MIRHPVIFIAVILAFTSCSKNDAVSEDNINTESEMASYESGPSFEVLSYVDRKDIQKHRVRVVHQTIKRTPDSDSGIYYTYYFDENGHLEASSPGFTSTTYYNFFDEDGRQTFTAWAEEYGAPIEDKKKLKTTEFMLWETGKTRSSHKVDVFNTCYSVNAQYIYFPTIPLSGALPKGGRFEYLRERPIEDVPDDFLPQSPKELFAEFRYEFYED